MTDRVVKVTLATDDGYWRINIDGIRSTRIKERKKEDALAGAMHIALQHNTNNMKDNIFEFWEVDIVNAKGVVFTIMSLPLP